MTETQLLIKKGELQAAIQDLTTGKMVRSTTGHDGSGASFVIPDYDRMLKELAEVNAELAGGKRRAVGFSFG